MLRPMKIDSGLKASGLNYTREEQHIVLMFLFLILLGVRVYNTCPVLPRLPLFWIRARAGGTVAKWLRSMFLNEVLARFCSLSYLRTLRQLPDSGFEYSSDINRFVQYSSPII